jgi:hypothetical protein
MAENTAAVVTNLQSIVATLVEKLYNPRLAGSGLSGLGP